MTKVPRMPVRKSLEEIEADELKRRKRAIAAYAKESERRRRLREESGRPFHDASGLMNVCRKLLERPAGAFISKEEKRILWLKKRRELALLKKKYPGIPFRG